MPKIQQLSLNLGSFAPSVYDAWMGNGWGFICFLRDEGLGLLVLGLSLSGQPKLSGIYYNTPNLHHPHAPPSCSLDAPDGQVV